MVRHVARILLVFLCTAAPAAADELRLANGDRLTGTVVSLAGGTLTFATAHGDLRIPWASVTALAIDDPILATIGTAEPVSVRIGISPTAGSVAVQPGGTVLLSSLAGLARPQPAVTVDGGANAGFVNADGNTEVNSLRLDGDLVVRQLQNRYSASAAVNRAQDRGTETARNWNTAFNYDRFLNDRLFVNGNAILTNDRFRDLDLRTALGAGVGYQVLKGARAALTANAGLGWVDENFEAGIDDRYTAARESAALQIFAVPDRVTFFHQHDGYFGVTGEDNLFVKMRNGVRIGLVGGLVTTVQHDLDYDRSPSPGRKTTDRTFALTFGYRF
jgi:putative salt-induced outer membrane protein YdiY